MKISGKDNNTKNIIINDNYKLKYSKLKIHMIYCLIIATIFIVGLVTIVGYNNDSLSNQVAFASTISGAILSVLAIIITIIGETKSDNTKDKLLNISDKLDNTVGTIDEAVKRIDNSTNNFNDLNKEIENKIEGLNISFKEVSGKISEYANNDQKLNSQLNVDNEEKNAKFNLELLQTIKLRFGLYPHILKDIFLLLYYLKQKFQRITVPVTMLEVYDDYFKMTLDSSFLASNWNVSLLFSISTMSKEDFKENIEEYLLKICPLEKVKIDRFFLS